MAKFDHDYEGALDEIWRLDLKYMEYRVFLFLPVDSYVPTLDTGYSQVLIEKPDCDPFSPDKVIPGERL